MDKNEFNLKAEKMKAALDQKDYATAASIADGMVWDRSTNTRILMTIAQAYEKARRYDDARNILNEVYNRIPESPRVIYRLAELAVKMGDLAEAEELYKEYCDVAPKDPLKLILAYRIAVAADAPLSKRIAILEAYYHRDFDEKWAYELATLYQLADRRKECVALCDEIILWFSVGPYVERAMNLKVAYEPLTPDQEEKRDHKDEFLRRLAEMARANARENMTLGQTNSTVRTVTRGPVAQPISDSVSDTATLPTPEELNAAAKTAVPSVEQEEDLRMTMEQELAQSIRTTSDEIKNEAETVASEDVSEARTEIFSRTELPAPEETEKEDSPSPAADPEEYGEIDPEESSAVSMEQTRAFTPIGRPLNKTRRLDDIRDLGTYIPVDISELNDRYPHLSGIPSSDARGTATSLQRFRYERPTTVLEKPVLPEEPEEEPNPTVDPASRQIGGIPEVTVAEVNAALAAQPTLQEEVLSETPEAPVVSSIHYEDTPTSDEDLMDATIRAFSENNSALLADVIAENGGIPEESACGSSSRFAARVIDLPEEEAETAPAPEETSADETTPEEPVEEESLASPAEEAAKPEEAAVAEPEVVAEEEPEEEASIPRNEDIYLPEGTVPMPDLTDTGSLIDLSLINSIISPDRLYCEAVPTEPSETRNSRIREVFTRIHEEHELPKAAIARIDMEKLNRLGLDAVMSRLNGRDLLVEGSGVLSRRTAESILSRMEKDDTSCVMVLTDDLSALTAVHDLLPDVLPIGLLQSSVEELPEEEPAEEIESEAEETEEAPSRRSLFSLFGRKKAEPSKEVEEDAEEDADEEEAKEETGEESAAANEEVPSETAGEKKSSDYDASEYDDSEDTEDEEDDDEEDDEDEDPNASEEDLAPMTTEAFMAYIRDYATENDCRFDSIAHLAIAAKVDQYDRNGKTLNRKLARKIMNRAIDRAERWSFATILHSRYDKEGYLILKESHFSK